MSESHAGGEHVTYNPITGEAPGIKEILERRAAAESGGTVEAEVREQPREDEAERAASELATWRQRATEAEARANEEARLRVAAERARADTLRTAEDASFTSVSTALAATEREITSLKDEMKNAFEAADYGKAADISSRLGELAAEARDLSRGKEEYERTRTERLNESVRPAAPQIVASTAAERSVLSELGVPSRDAFLATRSPQTADWLRQHPEFFTDPAAFKRISGADTLAQGRGIRPDTPEYFDFIGKESMSDTRGADRRATEREPPAGAAPPSREGRGPTGRPAGTKSGDVYVTQEQKQAAQWLGIDPAEYARSEADLRARGEIPYRRR